MARRLRSLTGLIFLAHITLVILAVLYSRHLAGPDGVTQLSGVTALELRLRDAATDLVTFPLFRLYPFPDTTPRGGPTTVVVIVTATLFVVNSLLVACASSGVIRFFITPGRAGGKPCAD